MEPQHIPFTRFRPVLNFPIYALSIPFLLIIGLMFSFMGIFTAYAGSTKASFSVANDYITPLSFYPLSFTMALFLLGVVMVLFAVLWNIFDSHPSKGGKPAPFLRYCRQISKYSLTIYISHFALFFIPLRVIQFLTGKYYLRQLTSTSIALGLAVLLLILYYPLLKFWDKAAGRFSFAWLLARVLSACSRETAS
jgi:hypothetical protein